jgi:hypothetical protein
VALCWRNDDRIIAASSGRAAICLMVPENRRFSQQKTCVRSSRPGHDLTLHKDCDPRRAASAVRRPPSARGRCGSNDGRGEVSRRRRSRRCTGTREGGRQHAIFAFLEFGVQARAVQLHLATPRGRVRSLG